ncbi:hypothetical protein BGW36DRAFT_76906 [Talaromyces proteolyticus]|uniref:Uncharacterized protein n=1 Tax=Talaromyces proteolyticus TaxID=1131652 RepID=A0AAD4KDK6_9EURO|nr:uncharacterized protein BGW36DRAFT_76906 [Talaromyces proteolyticus]KAH8689046.1 hypothetical protein BGW36DRAFT_76906 [Talaromyces proteolyticus]
MGASLLILISLYIKQKIAKALIPTCRLSILGQSQYRTRFDIVSSQCRVSLSIVPVSTSYPNPLQLPACPIPCGLLPRVRRYAIWAATTFYPM